MTSRLYTRRRTARDANSDPRLPENREAFRRIISLSRRIHVLMRSGDDAAGERAVLHDALLEYYPEYGHKINAIPGGYFIAFNPHLALQNHREELAWAREAGTPYRGMRSVFFEGSIMDLLGARVPGHRTWEARYGHRPATWYRHGIVVFTKLGRSKGARWWSRP